MDKIFNDKFLTTANKMKKSIAFMSTSVLIAPFITPFQEVEAAEKTTSNQIEAEKHTQNPFLNAIISPATSIAEKNDLYASVMLAQAILESAWGQSSLGAAPNYNLFGIKGDYNGESVRKNTLEDNGKQEYYQIEANFRKYPSYHESLEDYAELLKNGTSWDPDFYSGAWKSNAETYQAATEYLTGRYATDTAYAAKLNRIIETHSLDSYDGTPTVPGYTYVVKNGDTLYGIAKTHQISLNDLMKWNQLTSSIIHPGMALKVIQEKPVEKAVETVLVEKTEKVSPKVSTYQVQSGDTLWSISNKNNVTVAQLKEWNQLKNDIIQPGQDLKLGIQQIETPKAEIKEKAQEEAQSTNPTEVRDSVTVKSGDTLYRIAQQAKMSVSALKSLNQLKNDIIHPGQVLLIQGKVSQPKPVVEKTTPAAVTSYTVQKGDTLYRIANKHGVSVLSLMEWNQVNSTLIHPGQTLKVK